ncbi:MAG: MBL fold metallo-hydrolase [Bdellovibrionales bacterium]|nr:MBL fold metallo-hydrolase [Bdellovibrionales bacterium]
MSLGGGILLIQNFYDKETGTHSYVVFDSETRDAVVIDPVWNYNHFTATLTQGSVDEILGFVSAHSLNPIWVLETHIHADHISASQIVIREHPNCRLGIGEKVKDVQENFNRLLGLEGEARGHERHFDQLFRDGEDFSAGSLKIRTLHLPGHTPACLGYLIGNSIFLGDVIFMPDAGTGRCDFPGGSSRTLYSSISQKLYKLPDSTNVYVGHDYGPNGREIRFHTTVGDLKNSNIHLKSGTTENEFVKFREDRDSTLEPPKLIHASLQFNLRGGRLPPPNSKGVRHVVLPISIK